MKKLHKGILYLALIFLALTFAHAEKALTKEAEKYLEKTREITGDRIENAAKGVKVEDKKGGYFDNYMDTVIWNDTFNKRTDDIALKQVLVAGTESIVLDTPVENLQAQWDAEEARLAALHAGENNASDKAPIIFAGGYCMIEETLSISKFNEYGKLDCLLDFGGGQYKRAEVFSSFYPDYKREMVIAIPMYMTFEDDSRASFSGIVLKANKTSMNMAGWVDNRRIQKMLGEGLLMTNDIIYNYANGYMNALIQSRRRQELIYPDGYNDVNGTNGGIYNEYGRYNAYPRTVTNIAPPEAKDYIISAGMVILSNIFAIKGKDYLYSKEPLFAVYPQKVYVEGMVSFDNQGLAQRFGNISQANATKALNNNQSWKSERDQIIQRYGAPKTGFGIGGIR